MYVSRMDKLIFLMRRKEMTTRDSFFRHYLEVHSLLGLSLVPTLDGYTVNITDVMEPPQDDIHHPDAVVEMWTRDIGVFMDMNRTFAKPEDREIIVQDDASFIGASWAWQVEETLVRGAFPEGELRTRTNGVKRVSLHSDDSERRVADGVTHAVEHRVISPLMPGRVGETLPDPAPYQADVILSEWAPSVDHFGAVEGPAFLVSEYRQRNPLKYEGDKANS